MLSLVLLLCVLCSVCFWLKYGRIKSSTHPLPPVVPGKWPVIGHTLMLFKYLPNLQDLLKYVSEDCAKQGGLTHFYFGSELYYFIIDPQDAFTAANVCLKRHYAFDLLKGWMGDGLITSSGDIWKRHRKLLTPAFTLPVVYGFLDVFNSQAKKLGSSVESHVGKGLFDHTPYLKKNTLETLCGPFAVQKYLAPHEFLHRPVFGAADKDRSIYWQMLKNVVISPNLLRINVTEYKWSPMTVALHKILVHGKEMITHSALPIGVLSDQAGELRNKFWRYDCEHHIGTFGIDIIDDGKFTLKYMESADEMINIAINKTVKFWMQNNFIYRLFGLKTKEEEVVRTLHAMAIKVLQKKKSAMKNEAETAENKYKAFLDLLLDLSKNGELTDREIREEMDTIIAAGFETTSNQLTYTLLLLGAHPEIQEKLFEELLEVLGADRDVEKDDVNKLVYTNAVIMESLRAFPSIPAVLRTVDKDVKLKNYTMRSGSYCVLFPPATHLDSSLGAHSDQFRPERWLDGDFRNNKEFSAFGLGKRACIGRTYTMVSMTVTLAHFIRRYRVTADIRKLKLKYEFVMRPASGHEISIERRP